MMWLRKSKKGFTLIELMVVVAIIGVLALLGLRLYTGQQDKAKAAVVKANAGTTQTLIQAELADTAPTTVASMFILLGESSGTLAGMHNPFTSTTDVVISGAEGAGTVPLVSHPDKEGQVVVTYNTTDKTWYIQGYGAQVGSTDVYTAAGELLTASR